MCGLLLFDQSLVLTVPVGRLWCRLVHAHRPLVLTLTLNGLLFVERLLRRLRPSWLLLSLLHFLLGGPLLLGLLYESCDLTLDLLPLLVFDE